MAEENAIWHALIKGVQQGPFTNSQVFELLRGGMLSGNDLLWCPDFPDWKSVSEVDEFQQPQSRAEIRVLAEPSLLFDLPLNSVERTVGQKWSLWKSGSIGLLVSAFTLVLQVATGRGFELADYAHTRSAGTISALVGQILAAPLIFVLVALLRNQFDRRQSKPSTSTIAWSAVFVALLVGVFVALFVYGETYFTSDDVISGEARKDFVANVQSSCVRNQRSISQAATEAQIQSYCTCVSAKAADGTTYRQLGAELNARALTELRQKLEAVGYSCR